MGSERKQSVAEGFYSGLGTALAFVVVGVAIRLAFPKVAGSVP